MKRKTDISNLLKKDSNIIDWNTIDGKEFIFNYDEIIDKAKISKHDKESRYVWIDYKDIKDFKIHIQSLRDCRLGTLLNKKTSKFKKKIGDIIKDEKRDLEIIDMEYRIRLRENNRIETDKWCKYRCNKCGHEDWVLEANLLNEELKRGCASCAGRVINIGFNDIPTTDPWMVKFFPGGEEQAKQYTRCSNDKIIPICPLCGREKDKAMIINNIYKRHSIGCPYCGDGFSYPEKFAHCLFEQVLDDNFIHGLTSTTFKWIKKYRYDFYLPLKEQEYIVETDGGWHKDDNNLSGQTAEESKAIDDLKDELAIQHNIEVIRIPCYESTLDYMRDEILKSKLAELFDLSNIDWKKCHEFALSNKVKEACELKKNNQNLTTKEIAKKMKLNRNTIIDYLKKGTILDWCEYNPQKEHEKIVGKEIEIFKDGISFGIFPSQSYLQRKSLEMFKIQFDLSGISRVCNKKQKKYKGYEFKYVK